MVNLFVCGGFGSNGFLTKAQPFPRDGYYMMDIISDVSYPRSGSIIPRELINW
jgi:hypothetical protein